MTGEAVQKVIATSNNSAANEIEATEVHLNPISNSDHINVVQGDS